MANPAMTALMVLGLGVGGFFYTQSMMQPTDRPENPVRFSAGGAKFVKTTGNTRTGSPKPTVDMPFGVVNMMSATPERTPSTGLSLSDLQARQRAEAAGLVTQRHGSASLVKHNDVARMDGMKLP